MPVLVHHTSMTFSFFFCSVFLLGAPGLALGGIFVGPTACYLNMKKLKNDLFAISNHYLTHRLAAVNVTLTHLSFDINSELQT